MLEIIALIFIAKDINKIAIQKGLKPLAWKIYAIACWFVLEIIGIALGVFVFKQVDLIELMFLGLVFAFGGFLIIRAILSNKPDNTSSEDINRIGVDDLRP
ncbi:hypothetical protein [Ferruginibacter sp.]